MTRRVLVTTGNGMFGNALVAELANRDDIQVRAMVRDRSKFKLSGNNIEVVEGDMDDPASLVAPLTDVTHVYLSSPMDGHIAERETAVVDAARAGGAPHIVAIYGAVRHHGDSLDSMHVESINHLKNSGLPWTLVSPNSVMETSLAPFASQLGMGAVMGMSGSGRVGLVALADVARVSATVITTAGHEGENLECTGPAALDMAEVTALFSNALLRPIAFYDLPEDEFAKMLLEHGAYPDMRALEINVLCHLRAWRNGDADLVTDTVARVTGHAPVAVADWIAANIDDFAQSPSMADRIAGFFVRRRYGKYKMTT
ncbi:MAG: NAD(P)H-binding protein [Candidatus Nanopelagicales bacterium]|nr:NAD(P)H-binding protein [Candidatus Nanopelagicales bacterium]